MPAQAVSSNLSQIWGPPLIGWVMIHSKSTCKHSWVPVHVLSVHPPSIHYSAIDRGHSVLPAVFCATLNWSLQSDLMRHFSFWVTQIVQTFPEEMRQLGRHSYTENVQSAVQQAALCQCQTVKCSLGTTKNVYSSQTWLCMVPHSSVKSTSASDLGMGVSL